MKKNIGSIDKLIRVVIAFTIGMLNLYKVVDGIKATVVLSIAVYLAITALLNFSILYAIFGLNTLSRK